MRLLFRIWSKGELICCKCVLLSPTNYAHILWNQNVSVSIFISKLPLFGIHVGIYQL